MAVDESLVNELEEFFSTKYSSSIARLRSNFPNERSLYVKYFDLDKWNVEIADQLRLNPDEIMEAANEALKHFDFPGKFGYEPHVRFVGLPDASLLIQDIGAAHIDTLIRVEGVITKRAESKPKVKLAMYKCSNCGATYKVFMTQKTKPLKVCEVCKKRVDFSESESRFIDIQMAEMQELLERLKGGSPASHIPLLLEDDMVNTLNPGDNVIVNAILRIKPPQKNRGKNNDNIYSKFLDVISVEKMQKDFEQIEISDEEEQEILKLSRDPNIIKRIAASIAPGIYGHEMIKEAISLQLFGGTRGKTLPGGAKIRNDIHMLLIGDPGAAKSRLLHYVADIAPKSVYVSGKSVSGVGLTASAERDELGDGGWVLKAGALVLASGGIAAIDEFDKIDDKERAALHEAMESQTVSVAKAGIVARFKTKTAIIAAANPKYGRFNPNQYPSEQFDIPPTILSRFDLIFPVFDKIDEDRDRMLAEHILKSHANILHEEIKKDVIDRELLRKYIAYARKYVSPKLTEEAMNEILEFYVQMRKMGRGEGSVPITARQIEGIIRLSEASAKARLSEFVELVDAQRAIKLFRKSLELIAMDKDTGKFDIDIIATGQPKARTEKLFAIINIVKELASQYDVVEIDDVISKAKEVDIQENESRKLINSLIEKGELYSPRHGTVRPVDKK